MAELNVALIPIEWPGETLPLEEGECPNTYVACAHCGDAASWTLIITAGRRTIKTHLCWTGVIRFSIQAHRRAKANRN